MSIVTASYNSSGFIADTISSVRKQTYSNWEMIVVDDASEDHTCQIVRRWAKDDHRISLIASPRNKGPAASRNAGIEAARGRYITFLDSDDLWLPDKTEEQLRFMRKYGCVLSYTAYKKIDENGNLRTYTVEVPAMVTYEELLSTNVIACLTAMYDRKLLGKVYMPDIAKRHDYGLWLKILKMGHNACGLNKCLALYRVRIGSVSRNKARAAYYQWKVYRESEGLPLHKSIGCFLKYAYYGFIKSRM